MAKNSKPTEEDLQAKRLCLCMRFACFLHAFCLRFPCVLHVLCMRFTCVLPSFSLRFACALHAFYLHFACVLPLFCLRFACVFVCFLHALCLLFGVRVPAIVHAFRRLCAGRVGEVDGARYGFVGELEAGTKVAPGCIRWRRASAA